MKCVILGFVRSVSIENGKFFDCRAASHGMCEGVARASTISFSTACMVAFWPRKLSSNHLDSSACLGLIGGEVT